MDYNTEETDPDYYPGAFYFEDQDVYHIYTGCDIQIERQFRDAIKNSTGGRKRCDKCASSKLKDKLTTL